ncbi:Cytochrome c551 peroxidase precursor [Pirellulimonas nuda]|uniref:Cytochrome c551 peroxidase n=1 Tax=Pirellulimonas nuda TaxID=2528009 RepID=A0A518DID6_9BACT|nr:cytochrome c peroxidase [Pirellulimonas nuda]QDU91239.1 Cytochrome c551 peroxidase precursor [Pirellulimonas nuda]
MAGLVLRVTLLAALAAPALTVGSEAVELGVADLLSGVPGDGPLRADEVRAWLADPENHNPLRPKLPLGLAAGAMQTAGLAENPLTRAKIELGRQLYFDGRLSGDGAVSCASCHDPDHGYAADTRFGIGVGAQEGTRNSPTVLNRIVSGKQFWDGRAGSLEEQAIGPIANPIEMGHTHDACAECLAGVEVYRLQFEAVFPEGVTIENIGRAIACFERTIVTGASPWDYQQQLARFEKAYAEDLAYADTLEEDDPALFDQHQKLKRLAAAQPMSAGAKRGAELFFSQRVGCAQCHVGANLTDELYHNLGVGMGADVPDDRRDWGRFAITGDDADRGAFKTPTLRNIAQTAPYMHDGSQATLMEVVQWYDKGGEPNAYLSDKVLAIGLSAQEKEDLVAFLEALTGELPEVERGRLPE